LQAVFQSSYNQSIHAFTRPFYTRVIAELLFHTIRATLEKKEVMPGKDEQTSTKPSNEYLNGRPCGSWIWRSS
jgi:hypothetical protein